MSNATRIDVLISLGRQFGTDVRVTYPGARFSGIGKGAMNAAFEEKLKKYGPTMERQGVQFTHLIIETTGRIHDESMRWLRAIA
eukprot:gene6897-biopygen4204